MLRLVECWVLYTDIFMPTATLPLFLNSIFPWCGHVWNMPVLYGPLILSLRLPKLSVYRNLLLKLYLESGIQVTMISWLGFKFPLWKGGDLNCHYHFCTKYLDLSVFPRGPHHKETTFSSCHSVILSPFTGPTIC